MGISCIDRLSSEICLRSLRIFALILKTVKSRRYIFSGFIAKSAYADILRDFSSDIGFFGY